MVDTGKALQRAGVQMQTIQNMLDPLKPVPRILQCHAAYETVYLISLGQQEFSEIRSVLSRNTRDQSLTAHLFLKPPPWIPRGLAVIGAADHRL